MKVLWFAVTPSLYSENNTTHNGGGWIASLEKLIRRSSNIQLGVAFEHSDDYFKVEREDVVYYPINVWKSKALKLKRKLIYSTEEDLVVPACLKVISDFQPDVIHVFGSEWCYGLVAKYTNVPVVIHMQGSIPPYYNARFPAGYNESDLIRFNGFNIAKTLSQLLDNRNFRLRAEREERILRTCSNYMGRTAWDKNLIHLYNPSANYYYCGEALRDEFFFTDRIWRNSNNKKQFVLTTTISTPLYKGVDTILKTAKLLKDNITDDFEWRVFGVKDIAFHEWKTKIKAASCNVRLLGTLSAEELRDELLDSQIFIHPSYIDNSPNSVCEAQLLGIPVISTFVGGVPSLIEHMVTGVLVPANDPFSLAYQINHLVNNRQLAVKLGEEGRKVALGRHAPETVVRDLLNIYETLTNETGY